MVPTSSELRAVARRSLAGNWGAAVGIAFLFGLISSAVSMVPYIGWIGTLLLSGPLTYGIYLFFLRLVRGESGLVAMLFKGFDRFSDTFVLYLLMSIFTFLWSLLLVIPGIIAAFRYSMSMFIMIDNPGIRPGEAIERSKQMMAGNKGRLFVLYLTFIGWWILGMLSFGIGFLWILPYLYSTQAAFYEDLKQREMQLQQPMQPYSSQQDDMFRL